LWNAKREQARRAVEPLAVRMRPRTFDEVAGQQHILGPGKLLRRMIAADRLTSLILHGPPGTGKTTLAEVIASASNRRFVRENAAGVGVARVREIIHEADEALTGGGRRTLLFLDEIHRFSRAQQDVLLTDVERGLITLIGATTENPLFAVNSALVSRSTLLRLEPLSEGDIVLVLRRAIADAERGYGALPLHVTDEALRVWATKCDGDARRALTALEVAVLSSQQGRSYTGSRGDVDLPAGPVHRCGGVDSGCPGVSRDDQAEGRAAEPPKELIRIDREIAEESIQQKAAVYDGTGDEHYDVISAMIKSVRGSDPDAAVYWLARMLDAGEDPRFIARRLAILASEDIGNADPRGIMIAAATWELVERIGMPECRITLSQCACYLALAPKSNAAYLAIDEAMQDVKQGRSVAVPAHIKDSNVKKASRLSADAPQSVKGESYAYAHTDGVQTGPSGVGIVGTQDYLGVNKEYYRPTEHGAEKLLSQRLDEIRRLRGRP
jgi:putative ATPase